MNKTLKKLIVPALCMLGMTAIVACDKNDSPAPEPPVPDEPVNPWDYDPTNPDEIPILSEAPTLFSGEENFEYDTIPTDMVGMPSYMVPYIAIYDDTISTITPTISHDKDIYFEYKGQKYCIGDTLPNTTQRNPIGHSVQEMIFSQLNEFPEISLGCFGSTSDEPVILRWPEKNLSVYITPVRGWDVITLPEDFQPKRDSTEGNALTYGVYVNGVGTRCGFSIRLTADGKIKLFKGIRNGQP